MTSNLNTIKFLWYHNIILYLFGHLTCKFYETWPGCPVWRNLWSSFRESFNLAICIKQLWNPMGSWFQLDVNLTTIWRHSWMCPRSQLVNLIKGGVPASLAQLVEWLLPWLGGTGFESQLGWPFMSYHLILVCVNYDLYGSLRINSRLHARLNNQISHPIHPMGVSCGKFNKFLCSCIF